MNEQQEPDQSKQCSMCGEEFYPADMVFLENKWVCADCKPSFVQMLNEGVSTADMTVARKKRLLVMGKKAMLPDQCVKCNSPAEGGRLKKNLYWHSSVIYLLIFLNVLLYVLVAMIVRKRVKIEIGLCKRHLEMRKRGMWISWLMLLLSVASVIASITYMNGWLGLTGFILFFAMIVCIGLMVSSVSAQKIDKEYVWIRGVNKKYLDTLPKWIKPT